MASKLLTAKVLGTVQSDVKVQGTDNANSKFGVVPERCANIILRQDFLNQHEEVVLKLGRPQESLVVGVDSCCNERGYARDGSHKPRMVIDYSQTINRLTLLDVCPLPNINEQISEIAKGSVFSTSDF